jgi:hypothetical protein
MIALKTPQMAIHAADRPVLGTRLELEVDYDKSSHGYDSMVIDVYEPDPDFSRWNFVRRVKRFHRTVHLTLNGLRYRCKRCEEIWVKEPRREDRVLWERAG